MSEQLENGVHAVLLQDNTGKYFWAVIYVGADDSLELVGDGYASCDATKSAAWAFAQAHGASFIPARRVQP